MDFPFRKTDKAREEIATRRYGLPLRTRGVLLLIDGSLTGRQLLDKFPGFSISNPVLAELSENGFIEPVRAGMIPGITGSSRPLSESQEYESARNTEALSEEHPDSIPTDGMQLPASDSVHAGESGISEIVMPAGVSDDTPARPWPENSFPDIPCPDTADVTGMTDCPTACDLPSIQQELPEMPQSLGQETIHEIPGAIIAETGMVPPAKESGGNPGRYANRPTSPETAVPPTVFSHAWQLQEKLGCSSDVNEPLAACGFGKTCVQATDIGSAPAAPIDLGALVTPDPAILQLEVGGIRGMASSEMDEHCEWLDTFRSHFSRQAPHTLFQAIQYFYAESIVETLGSAGLPLRRELARARTVDDLRALRKSFLEAIADHCGIDSARQWRKELDDLLYINEPVPKGVLLQELEE